MALFQKKPQVSNSLPLYTLSANQSYLILGLGNPGQEFKHTRHNIGFKVLDQFAQMNEFPDWITKKDLKCQLAYRNLGGSRVILGKPMTFMNISGEAATAVQHFYRIDNAHTLAVYDELALPFGQLRTRVGGSDAGHNGVKSLIQHLGEDFSRLRIGIGSAAGISTDPAKFVLSKFSKPEQQGLELILKEAVAVINEFVFSDQLPHDTRTVL
mgnify:CR=1 FL=1